MARHYSQRSFLRRAPNKLVRQYLEQLGIGDGIKWNALREVDVGPIFSAIQAAAPEVDKQCQVDFDAISDLADEGGVRTLIKEGKHPAHGVDLAPTFQGMDPLECAFWTFLHHPLVFKVAGRFDYADGLTFEKRGYLPPPFEPVTEASVPTLRAALSEYYCTEGRGRGCHVDHYRRDDDRLYYFCFLEDYAEARQVYNDEHEFTVEKQKPAFLVIFVYDPTHRTLETRVGGGRSVRAAVERIFGRTVLNVDLGEPPGSGITHELGGLLNRDFQFATLPDEGIDQVLVRRLKLSVIGRQQYSITLDVSSNAPTEAIYDLLDDVLAGKRFPHNLIQVEEAKLRVVFRADGRRNRRSRTFRIAHPDSHNLKANDPKDDIIKQCLRRWGLDVSGCGDSSTPKPGEPAQYRLWRPGPAEVAGRDD